MVEDRLKALGLRLDGPIRPPPARPGWEQYLVAQKPAGGGWPPDAAKRIAAARACYEAGTHEMVSRTTPHRWTQLYLIPRREKAPRNSFFTNIEAA